MRCELAAEVNRNAAPALVACAISTALGEIIMRGLICGSAFAALMLGSTLAPAAAQESRASLVPPGWSVGRVRMEGGRGSSAVRRAERVGPLAVSGRPLTVRRRPEVAPEDGDDPLFSGGTRYGNIRLFNPFPSIDSGTQLPYGLDGIGGYGSDIGYSAGADGPEYDRGP